MNQKTLIFHIAGRNSLNSQIQDGFYRPASLFSDGFIHCSPLDEILETASIWFAWQDDLIVLGIDPEKIPGKVRFEPAPGRVSLMPHIYGALPMDAVCQTLSFTRGSDGKFFLKEDSKNPA